MADELQVLSFSNVASETEGLTRFRISMIESTHFDRAFLIWPPGESQPI